MRLAFPQLVIVLLASVGPAVFGAEAAPPDAFQPIAPLRSAREFVRSEGWPTTPGGQDAVCYVLLLEEAGRRTQWLALVAHAELTAAEKAAGRPDEVRHTTTGRRLVFARTPRALRVEFAGPFSEQGASAPQRSVRRIVVARENLAAGFVEFARGARDLRARIEAGGRELSPYWIMRSRQRAADIEVGKAQAERIGMTEADERRTCDVLFALLAMYEAATSVPAFKEVLERIIEKPSVWSVVRSGGLNATITFPWHGLGIDCRDATEPPRFFQMPAQLNFNSQCALRAWIAFEEPAPPLDLVGGIRGAWAEHPKEASRRLRLHRLPAADR